MSRATVVWKRVPVICVAALYGCAVTAPPVQYPESDVVTEDGYKSSIASNGVVLMDVNWGRRWDCGDYENAQLISLVFDKLPMARTTEVANPSLVLNSPSLLLVDSVFLNYAYSLEAGRYAISTISIKVARPRFDVRFLMVDQDQLFDSGTPLGGTFNVKPGEVVFIGNFWLDCTYGPTLWRYHSDGREAFDDQIKEYEASFPFLDLDDVTFRLFETKEFGNTYELPQ